MAARRRQTKVTAIRLATGKHWHLPHPDDADRTACGWWIHGHATGTPVVAYAHSHPISCPKCCAILSCPRCLNWLCGIPEREHGSSTHARQAAAIPKPLQ